MANTTSVKKLNVILAITDELAKNYKNNLQNYSEFFANKQGAFKGSRKTYQPKEGTMDEPNKRGFQNVQTTVPEKLEYFENVNTNYINNLFALEATNAAGVAKAELIVEDESWGIFTSLELLRLKSLIDNPELVKIYNNIPVRSDSVIWKESADENNKKRKIAEDEIVYTTNKTSENETYILADPNVASGKVTNYTPQLGKKVAIIELGTGTSQNFSGEATQHQKAEVLKRRSILSVAITAALKKANEAEVIESSLNAEMIFGYLHEPLK